MKQELMAAGILIILAGFLIIFIQVSRRNRINRKNLREQRRTELYQKQKYGNGYDAQYYRENRQKLRNLEQEEVLLIDSMSGEEFEEFLAKELKRKGYKVELTPKSYDFGADLILVKHGIRTVVQVKQYSIKEEPNNRRQNDNGSRRSPAGRLAGIEAVQQAVAAVAFYDADASMVITSSYFTESALKLAKANDTQMWDRDRVVEEFFS